MSTWIDGTVGGGKLYCRKSPSTSAAAWGRFEMAQKLRSEMLKVILIGMKPIGITMSVKLATLFATTLMLS